MVAKISESEAQVATKESLGEFLRSLPANTPAEVIEAFDVFARADGPIVGPHLFYELVEQAPVAVSITDDAANIVYVNPAFEALTGYKQNEVIGKNQSMLSNNATPSAVYDELWHTIKSKRPWTGSLLDRRKDGDTYLVELTVSPVVSRDGRVSHFIGMHRDITEVHRLNRVVEHHKRLIETVIDAAPVCVALMDVKQRVILDNQEYKKLLGDLRGEEPAALFLKGMAEQTEIDLIASKSEQLDFKGVEIRLDVPGSGGPRWFSLSGTWVEEPDLTANRYFRSDDGRAFCLLLLANEITRQRREFERARIEHLRATLAEQQRVSGMREALAAANYQVQQPLNLINAAINILNGHQGDAHLLPVLIQIAESAAKARQALDSALPQQSDEEQRRLVNLNEILQEVLELNTDKLLSAGIVVEWLPQSVLPMLHGDTEALRGLFMNLVDNAIQALEENAQEQRDLCITTVHRDDLIIVTIRDNGIGLSTRPQLALFEPLYCGWQQKRGHAGMGLPMAQETACRHGGEIDIIPGDNGGCRVVVTIPLSPK